jgi:MoaA/NifB/PqqE/SkfB family radical SAM enzyme
LFLQNEPLLDSKLFKRIEFIKRIFPKSMISIHTNCLLLPKVKNKVIKLFDSKRMHFVMSLQGWDADSYNSIHGTKISQNYFHSMKEEVDCLNKILPSSFKEELPEEKIDEKYLLKHFRWSRGGFLSGDKQLHSKVNGCGGERDQSLNFLYDGSMILCCMDYLRETVYGNIKFQSLREVFETNLYKSYMRAVNGKIKTDDDFICKKCEIAK